MNKDLTFVEKNMVQQMLIDRKEDKLDPEFEARIDKIIELFKEGKSKNINYHQRMIIIYEIELKLETRLEEILRNKFIKIKNKLESI